MERGDVTVDGSDVALVIAAMSASHGEVVEMQDSVQVPVPPFGSLVHRKSGTKSHHQKKNVEKKQRDFFG